MKIESIHHRAIQSLLDNGFNKKTQAEIARELKISRRTLTGWLSNPDFQTAYQKALEKWAKDLSKVQFSNKKRRLIELERLYAATPDSYVDKLLTLRVRAWDPKTRSYIEVDVVADEHGQPIKDRGGNLIPAMAVRKMNVMEKARILEQIKDEVEPRLLRAGTAKKNADGSVEVIFVETGLSGENEIPWGDSNTPLPVVGEPEIEKSRKE